MSIKIASNPNIDNFNTLVCIDGSYVIYHTIYSAVNKWLDESEYSDIIENIDTSDPSFTQVDLVQYPDFIDILKSKIISTFYRINGLVNDFNAANFSSTHGKMFFVLDPIRGLQKRSWRFMLYEEYKGQRSSSNEKKPYNVYSIFDECLRLIRYDDILKEKFNFVTISVDNAEADDIIATIFTDKQNETFTKFLIANDHDYLQLNNVTQMNLEGKEILIEQPYPDKIKVTPDNYLLAKIITGDKSDNITQVFYKVGYKTAIKKFILNPDFLNESLENDAVAMDKFNRNAKLIDFSRIPKKIKAMVRKTIADIDNC